MTLDEETLRTSWTFVARLKHEGDESWDQLYEKYRGLIVGVARMAGLSQEEAEDVLQETMVFVSKNIQKFEADPARGSFRAWLLKRVRWRITDQLRKRLPVASGGQASLDGTARTPTVERVPNTTEVDLAGLCDTETKAWILGQAIKELQAEVKAEHYQIFHLLTAEQKSVPEVARMIERNRAQIYLINHRVANELKRIVKRLEKRLE